MNSELLIQIPDGTSRTMVLDGRRITLGRAHDNELAYKEDHILSRHHMAIEMHDGKSYVRDLGSKNGTLLNDKVLSGRKQLTHGDRIVAGSVTMVLEDPNRNVDLTPVFFEGDIDAAGSRSVSTHLDDIFSSTESGLEDVSLAPALDSPQLAQALMDATRELFVLRSLPELFRLILRLSIESAGARRGVVMTVENGELVVRAQQGEGFRISRRLRDRVLLNKTSFLMQDARVDGLLNSSDIIDPEQVRSLIAVPLQTADRVIGIVYVDSPLIARPFTSGDLNLLTMMANIAAIQIELFRLIKVEEAEGITRKELEQAADIQRDLLPKGQPDVPGLDIAGHSIPSRSVGGDYFDYLKLPGGRFGVIVADVAGKGLSAAILMSSLQARVQMLAEDTEDMAEFVTRLNRSVAANCPTNRFITFFMAMFDPATGEYSYCNAGHNPPFVVRVDGSVERLEEGGPVLGVFRQMKFQAGSAKLEKGDVVAMFSDGVTEARNVADEEYDEGPFLEELLKARQHPAKKIVETVHEALERFIDTAAAVDDITLVVVRKT